MSRLLLRFQSLPVHFWPAVTGAVVFLSLGLMVLPYPGLQTDEALFGAAIYQDTGYADSFRAWGHTVPTMLISYLGALKTWLYWLLFQLTTPTLWSIRLPMLILGAATVALTARLIGHLHSARAAWFAAALLATDPVLVLTTTFDWGPVALQHFLLVAAANLLWEYHQRARLAILGLAFFLLGLALWNKAVIAWNFAGLLIAALLCAWPLIRPHLRLATITVAVVAFAAGAFPFLRYNVRQAGATQSNIQFDFSDVPGKAALARDTANGISLFTYLVEDSPTPARATFVSHALLAAVILSLFFPSRALFFPLVAGLITWGLMLITKGAGGGVHHIVLLWPLPHWFLAAAFTAPRIRYATYAWLVIALLAADNLRVFSVYQRNLVGLGSPASWSEAILPLSRRLNEMVTTRIHLFDWGVSDNIVLLAGRPLPIWFHDRPYQPPTIFAPQAGEIWIGNVDARQQFPNVNRDLLEAAARAGYEKEVVETFTDKQSRPAYELFRFRPRRPSEKPER